MMMNDSNKYGCFNGKSWGTDDSNRGQLVHQSNQWLVMLMGPFMGIGMVVQLVGRGFNWCCSWGIGETDAFKQYHIIMAL